MRRRRCRRSRAARCTTWRVTTPTWPGSVARPRGGVVVAELSFFRRDILVGPPGRRVPRRGRGVQPFVLRSIGRDGTVTDLAPQLLSSEVALERIDATRHY